MSGRIQWLTTSSTPAQPALVAVTAVWGLTFVQVKDAVAIFPVMPFLALRFGIAALVLTPFARRHVAGLGRRGTASALFAGALIAGGHTLQTIGLERTTVSSAGFVTGMYVVLTPLIALACFHAPIGRATWAGVALATTGLALLTGVQAGDLAGNLLVLGGAAVYSLQIVLMERYAPRYDPLGFTLIEMAAAFAVLAVASLPTFTVPRDTSVWGALVVTGVLASALAFLVQTWAQRVTTATRTALVFTLEPVFAAIFGYWLAGDRLGAAAWAGSLVIMAGIMVAGRDDAQVAVVQGADARRSSRKTAEA